MDGPLERSPPANRDWGIASSGYLLPTSPTQTGRSCCIDEFGKLAFQHGQRVRPSLGRSHTCGFASQNRVSSQACKDRLPKHERTQSGKAMSTIRKKEADSRAVLAQPELLSASDLCPRHSRFRLCALNFVGPSNGSFNRRAVWQQTGMPARWRHGSTESSRRQCV